MRRFSTCPRVSIYPCSKLGRCVRGIDTTHRRVSYNFERWIVIIFKYCPGKGRTRTTSLKINQTGAAATTRGATT